MTMLEAIEQLKIKKALNDGHEYAVMMDRNGDWRVDVKTEYHYMIDAQDTKLANTRAIDVLRGIND